MSYANVIIIGTGHMARALGNQFDQRSISHLLIDEEVVEVVRPMGGGYPGFQVIAASEGCYSRALVETGPAYCSRRETAGLFVLPEAIVGDGIASPSIDLCELAELVAGHLHETPLVV